MFLLAGAKVQGQAQGGPVVETERLRCVQGSTGPGKGEKDHGELQTFGGVYSHESDSVIFVRFSFVRTFYETHIFQKILELNKFLSNSS